MSGFQMHALVPHLLASSQLRNTRNIMSEVKIGKIAPFPPLPGQPYLPARNHPRWKELYQLHDEFIMEKWPFASEAKRTNFPLHKIAGFCTWCAPASDFNRMIQIVCLGGVFFLADDYLDSGKEINRIPGFKRAAEGNGNLIHPEDGAEIAHEIVFRAIKATGNPKSFEQLTRLACQWWDSHIHEPFRNLDQYLVIRRLNIGMYLSHAWFRHCLDINLSDEEIGHPLMHEAEGIVSDHVGLVNDYFSYLKEKLSNSDDTNIIRILMDHEKLDYECAMKVVEAKIRQKEQDFIPAGLAVLQDPVLGQNPEVHRWIANLPYVMGGNNAWHQESARYNLGNIPGEVPFPHLYYAIEATPEDEAIAAENLKPEPINIVKWLSGM